MKPMKEPLVFVFSKKKINRLTAVNPRRKKNRNWVFIPFETSQNGINRVVLFLWQWLKKNG